MLLRSIVDVRPSLQFSQQVNELCVVEFLVQGFIFVIGQLQALHVLQWNGQIIVIPGIIDAPKDLIWHADLGEDQEQSLSSFKNPFHVGIICQTLTKRQRPIEELALLSTQLRHHKSSSDFRIDAVVSPPELLERGVGCDEGRAAITVNVGVQSYLTSSERDLGKTARAHRLEAANKDPCVTRGRTQGKRCLAGRLCWARCLSETETSCSTCAVGKGCCGSVRRGNGMERSAMWSAKQPGDADAVRWSVATVSKGSWRRSMSRGAQKARKNKAAKRFMAEGKDDGRGLTVKDLDPYPPGRTTCWEQHVMERLPGSPR